jgi:hypothetical protein
LSYSWFQTSQTEGQWYSDTSPFSIPWINRQFIWKNHGDLILDDMAQKEADSGYVKRIGNAALNIKKTRSWSNKTFLE